MNTNLKSLLTTVPAEGVDPTQIDAALGPFKAIQPLLDTDTQPLYEKAVEVIESGLKGTQSYGKDLVDGMGKTWLMVFEKPAHLIHQIH